jgi:hypothetical protein
VRTLLAQIYEGGKFHDNAVTQKRGLYNAFAERGAVMDFDYLANDRDTLMQGFINRIEQFEPTLVFTQFHGADTLTVEQLIHLRERFPYVQFVNWSGDSWAWSLTAPAMLALARCYDLWLVCAPDTLPTYAEHGIHAKFWQIALERSVTPLPDMPHYDVVFLGNVISDRRRALLELLRGLEGINVGIYGDWERANGHNTYDFAAGEALYKNATLAIADMAYPDQLNYISNRPFQALAAGGAVLLHQHVARMDVLSGLVAGRHYVEWNSLDELPTLISAWLQDDYVKRREGMARSGRAFVLKRHTWQQRVAQVAAWLGELEQSGEYAT